MALRNARSNQTAARYAALQRQQRRGGANAAGTVRHPGTGSKNHAAAATATRANRQQTKRERAVCETRPQRQNGAQV